MTSHLLAPIFISSAQLPRLEKMATGLEARDPRLADVLLTELARASVLAEAEMPKDVVRVGSRLSYRDAEQEQAQSVELVWPEEADISLGRISVLTPLGTALLGLRAGDAFFWETRNGAQRQLKIVEVQH